MRAAVALSLSCMLLLTSGCWDMQQLDRRAFVVMAGIDRTPEGLFRVTAQVQMAGMMAKQGKQKGTTSSIRILTGEAQTIQMAIALIRGQAARALPQPFPFVIGVIRLPNFPLERVEMLARLTFHLNTIFAVANIYFTAGLMMAEVFGTQRIRPFMLVAAALSLLPQLFIPSAARATEVAYTLVILSLVWTWTLFPLLWLIYWLRGMGRHGPTQNGSHRAPPG